MIIYKLMNLNYEIFNQCLRKTQEQHLKLKNALN